MKDYRAIFDAAESTLLEIGSRACPVEDIEPLWSRLEVETKTFSDDEYYELLVDVIFFSGFRAATVQQKLPVIHGHFPTIVS